MVKIESSSYLPHHGSNGKKYSSEHDELNRREKSLVRTGKSFVVLDDIL